MNLTIIAFVFNFIISCWPKTNAKHSNNKLSTKFLNLNKVKFFAATSSFQCHVKI